MAYWDFTKGRLVETEETSTKTKKPKPQANRDPIISSLMAAKNKPVVAQPQSRQQYMDDFYNSLLDEEQPLSVAPSVNPIDPASQLAQAFSNTSKYEPQGILGAIETSKPYRFLIGNPEEGYSIGDMFEAVTMATPGTAALSTLTAGKLLGKGARMAKTTAGKVAAVGSDVWKTTPTVAKVPIVGGAGATAFETVRGATTPGYAERRETLPSELGASLRAGTGDVVNTAGQFLKWKGAEDAGNDLVETSRAIKEGYELQPEEFSWKSFFDPDFYAKNVARSVPFTASLIPLMYGGYKLGGTGAAKVGLGEVGKVISGAVAGTALSRPVESAMEAANTYEEALAKGMNEQEADRAAQEVFVRNLYLAGLDATQLAATFMPVGKVGKLGVTAGRIGFDTATESLEEGYQHAIQQQATGSDNRSVLQQIINPTQAGKESMAIGGIFGAGMGGVGAITDAMRGSEPQLTPEQLQQQYTQTWQDINQAYGNATKEQAPYPMQDLAEVFAQAQRQSGAEAEQAPDISPVPPFNPPSRTVTGAGRYKVVRPGEIEETTQEPTIQTGRIVYTPKGQALTVVDDSHPTELTVQSEDGHVYKIDRIHVKPEPPAGAKKPGAKKETEIVEERGQDSSKGSTADQIQQGFDVISGGVQAAGDQRTMELVEKQGYVGFKNPQAAEAFRNDPRYAGWTETQVDGEFRFSPPQTETNVRENTHETINVGDTVYNKNTGVKFVVKSINGDKLTLDDGISDGKWTVKKDDVSLEEPIIEREPVVETEEDFEGDSIGGFEDYIRLSGFSSEKSGEEYILSANGYKEKVYVKPRDDKQFVIGFVGRKGGSVFDNFYKAREAAFNILSDMKTKGELTPIEKAESKESDQPSDFHQTLLETYNELDAESFPDAENRGKFGVHAIKLARAVAKKLGIKPGDAVKMIMDYLEKNVDNENLGIEIDSTRYAENAFPRFKDGSPAAQRYGQVGAIRVFEKGEQQSTKGIEESKEKETKPVYTWEDFPKGTRVKWEGRRGEKLTGKIDRDTLPSDTYVTINCDQIAYFAGGVPLGRIELVNLTDSTLEIVAEAADKVERIAKIKEGIEKAAQKEKEEAEKPKEEPKQEQPSTATLTDYDLRIVKTTTKKGTPVWELKGDTKPYAATFRRLKARWYGPKKVWSFFTEEDPTPKILAALPPKEGTAKPVQQEQAETKPHDFKQGDRVAWKNPKGQTITGTVKSSSPNRVEVLVDKGVNEWVDSIFAEAMANFLGAEINKLSRIETEKKKTETTVVKQPDAGIQSNQEEGSAPKQPKPESSSSAEQKPTGPAGSEPQQGVKAANQSREWLEKMEQAARARLKARHGGSVRMLAGLPMDDLVDYSIIGMCKLANKTMDIAEFSAEMLGEFGDNLKLFIHAIYAQSKAMLDMEPAQIDEMIELAAKDKEDNTPQETPDGGEGDGRGNPGQSWDNGEGALEEVSPDDVSPTANDRETEEGPDRGARIDERSNDSNRGRTSPKTPDDRGGEKGLSQEGRVPQLEETDSLGDGEGGVDTSSERRRRTRDEEKSGGLGDSIGDGRGINYSITEKDNLGEGGPKTKARANIAAIKLAKEINKEGRLATTEEKKILVKYTGWGGLKEAFEYWNRDWHDIQTELREVLTNEEYESARRSTQFAHYTSPEVIRAMYSALERMGFTGGRVLEPALGIGHFFGLMPGKLAKASKLTGIEIDPISGTIAQALYPQADIRINGYEKENLPDNFYDLVISNVPFADVKVVDSKYPPYLRQRLHTYYFAKSLDKVRPGGIVMFISSTGTMDAEGNARLRKYLAKKAELVGAFRLPSSAFKKIANTEVTTDVIILRKLHETESASEVEWVEVVDSGIEGKTGARISINEYYRNHPEYLLGDLSDDKLHPGRAALTPDGRDTKDAIQEVVESLPTNVFGPSNALNEPAPLEMLVPALGDVKPGAFVVNGNAVFCNEEGKLVPLPDIKGKKLERIKGLIQIRDALREVIVGQTRNASDAELKKSQAALNKAYDDFVKKFGFIHNKGNKLAFVSDPDYPALLALEDYNESTKTATKADIFTKRTIGTYTPVEKTDNAKEALLVSLNEYGAISWDRMSQLTGKNEEALREELAGLIYLNPQGGNWETADQYLSGNVREKLRAAIEAAKQDSYYEANVEALKAVQPKDLTAAEISVRLGSPWVKPEYVKEFIDHIVDIEDTKINVFFDELTATWIIQKPSNTWAIDASAGNTRKWGTSRITALKLIELTLKNQKPVIKDIVGEDDYGNPIRVVNEKETAAARDKQDQIELEFAKWIWEEDARKQILETEYNERFNNLRLRSFDGSHLTLPGMNKAITLRPHQKDAIWRAIQGGNTLFAHVVGAGKTYTVVATAMEMKRMGLIRKPVVVVPNHLVGQWAKEWYTLYPTAKILALSGEDIASDKHTKNATINAAQRKKVLSRIATGDWDGVILSQTAFQKLPMGPEFIQNFVNGQVLALEQAMESAREAGLDKKTVKQMEKSKDKLRSHLEEMIVSDKKDMVMGFDELGIDYLFVDEADMYKNLYVYTKMRNVAGVQTAKAKRALDMFIKTQYLNQLKRGRGVVFATGTPISNSMSEMFTLMRYLMYDNLEEMGLASFDAWANTFGRIITAMELAPDAKNYRPKTKFAEFVNLPELMTIYRTFADIQTMEQLNLPVPKVKRTTITSPGSDALKDYVDSLADRLNAIKSGQVPPTEDNPLKVCTDGRKAALDMRLVDPMAPDEPNSKINLLVENVFETWKATKAKRKTQLIFLDLSTPKAKKMVESEAGFEGEGGEAQEDIVLYQEIKQKLIRMGVPAKEIAFIHDANTKEKKNRLFADMNEGNIRVLIGSTEKMGAGMNVQRKLVKSHHVNPPWRPRDVEQQEGRIVRQGNEEQGNPDFEVEIVTYITEGSFDAYMWQKLENKARFINQVMVGGSDVRSMEDVDEMVLSYAEMKAVASGNPLVLEKVNLDNDVRKLQLLKISHEQTIREMKKEQVVVDREIGRRSKEVENLKEDVATAEANKTKEFRIKINKKEYVDRKEAAKALQEELVKARKKPLETETEIGSFSGFALSVYYDRDYKANFSLKGKSIWLRRRPFGESSEGNIQRIENAVAGLGRGLEIERDKADAIIKRASVLKEEIVKPFQKQGELDEKLTRQAQVNRELGIDRPADEVVVFEEAAAAGKSDTQPEVTKEGGGDSADLDSIIDELASEVDEAIEEATLPMGQSIKIVRSREDRQKGNNKYHLQDKETEERMRAAKGLSREALRVRIKNWVDVLSRKLARGNWEHLPRNAEFARIRFALDKLQKQKGVASDKTLRALQGILLDMTPYEYDVFTFKVILDDLKHEAEAGHILPFGFTPKKLESELERIDKEIKSRPQVKKALQKRQKIWDAIKKARIDAAKAVGVNLENRFTREDYYRHQVLEYANAKGLTGKGKKLRTPVNRGYLKKREGSSFDINTDYLQADFEVMAQMFYDIELDRVIKVVDDNYNIMEQLKAQAIALNDEKIMEQFEAMAKELNRVSSEEASGKEVTAEGLYRQTLNKKQAIGFSKLGQLAARGELPLGANDEWEWLVDELAENYLENKENKADGLSQTSLSEEAYAALFKYLNYLLKVHGGETGSGPAAMIYKGMAEKKKYIKEQLGNEYVTWKKLIPDGYTVWQPREGSAWYRADSIPAAMAEQLYEEQLIELGVKKEDLRKVFAKGQRYREYVVKEEVAETLNNLQQQASDHIILEIIQGITNVWKINTLLSPRRAFKYNLRNISGDADAVAIGNPDAFKFAPRATKELFQVFYGDRSMTPDMRDWFERGGMQTLLQVQELGEINNLKMFKQLAETKGSVKNIPARTWQRYWKSARVSTDFREAILRYAAYLSYLEQMKGSTGGRPRNFGASLREEVMALDNIKDRAFKLSNDLLGAYDEISIVGQGLRKYVAPFWSWNEVNFVRYKRLWQNAIYDQKLAEMVGRKLVGYAVRSPIILAKTGMFVLKASWLLVMLQLWNMLFFGDEEKELPDSVKQRAHIIFGRDENGNIVYFSRLGAFQDLVDWVGLDVAPQHIIDLLNGRKTIKEIAIEMAKSPVNKLAQAINPLFKAPPEMLTRTQFFPDVFKPRYGSVKDRGLYLAQQFGLENEYKAFKGMPTRGYGRSVKEAFVYLADPEESAYNTARENKYRWIKENSPGKDSEGFHYSAKSEALYNIKMSIRYKDEEAFNRYLEQYAILGGTKDGLKRSLESLHPLYGLNRKEQDAYVQSLNAEDKAQLRRALIYYETVLNPKKP